MVECSPRMPKIGVRSPVEQTYVVETGSDSSTAKRSASGVNDFGDDHYKGLTSVTVGVAR